MATTSNSSTRTGVVTMDHSASAAVRRQKKNQTVITYLLLTLSGLLFAFPLYWTASSSLQTWQELRSFTPHLFPISPQWGNYVEVFQAVPFARWLLNSLLIVAITIPGTLITSTMTAYAFARFNFVGKGVWFVLMLGTMMIPATVTLIPQYLLWFKLKMINTYVPLTIGSWLGGSAFMIFLLRQFFMQIPPDLEEAARIDGAGTLQIIWHVVLPLRPPNKAEQPDMNRYVAIKILHAGAKGVDEMAERFEREAQAAGQIGSEHIVEVYDLGMTAAGERFMVMEYLEGEPLRTRIKRQGRLSPGEIVTFFGELLEGFGPADHIGTEAREL